MKQEKTVLVTGCSSGLGECMASYLRDRGWTVYATVRKVEDMQRLEKDGFESLILDLGSSTSIHNAVEDIGERSGGEITALINNAGLFQIGAVEDLKRDTIRQQFEINVFGTIELTNAIVRLMRKKNYGKIVFISSVNGRFTFPFIGAYCASKYAIDSFCEALRRELIKTGITVSNISPGQYRTRIMDNAVSLFMENIDVERSIHKNTYDLLIRHLDESWNTIPKENSVEVAREVHMILEGRKSTARSVVPFKAKIHDWANKILPERVQDKLLMARHPRLFDII
jgi:NAD(P)-dependent dehydrogenase (short-subunit alcohol dehydrogenase family)